MIGDRKRDKLRRLKSKVEWKLSRGLNYSTPLLLSGMVLSTILISCDARGEEDVVVPQYNDLRDARLDSRQCLAVNSYFEGRSESDTANYAIMTTVYKRTLLGGRYGDSFCNVIFKPYMYSWTNDKKADYIKEKDQYLRMYHLAGKFLLNKDLFLDTFEGVDHYKKVGHKTTWDYRKLDYVGRFDNHVFYRHK